MKTRDRGWTMRRCLRLAPAGLALLTAAAAAARAEEDALQAAVRETIARTTPAYVFIGGGSGVMISSSGEFLTNQHVALSSQRWQVRLADGRVMTARRLGADAYGDVALLKIEGGQDLPFVAMGDSDALKPGEPVIAIGNPFALGGVLGGTRGDPAVSLGIVSAIHRRQGAYMDAIQTDASINPGNSGGPLFNLRGELVGINGRIATRFGNRVNSGVGFAIPVNQIRRFLPVLREGGGAFHGMVEGLQTARRHTGGGTLVTSVAPGSVAARAGFVPGDVVVAVDRYPTPTWARFDGVVSSFPEGADLDVTVRRGGAERRLPVRLGRLLDREAEIRFLARTVPVELGIRVDDAPGGGVVLVEVAAGAPAAAAGLKTDDVVTLLNGRRVAARIDYYLALRWARAGAAVPFEALRGSETVRGSVTPRARVPEEEAGGEEEGGGEE
jgi:serine protease Do